MARNRRGRRRFSGLFLVIGCEAFVGGTRSEAVEVQKDTWDWAVSMLSVARHFDGAQGKVAPMGDSNTYANPAGRWVRIGVGKSRAEAALSRWMYSHREDEHNGWWLAADDQPEGRSWTAASGVRSGEFLAGGKGGLPSLDEMLAAHSPQIVSILLGTNDLHAGVSAPVFLANMETILRTCVDAGVIPIVNTLPPTNWGATEQLLAYNHGLIALARRLRLPMIDVYGEFLTRRPAESWLGTLVGQDGAHLTPVNAAGPATEQNLMDGGYLLRCWLQVRKVAQIKARVIDVLWPPASLLAEGVPRRAWFPKARRREPPSGAVVPVATVEDLLHAVEVARPGQTILLADGHYMLPRYLEIRTDSLTLRGASGDRHAVVLDGGQSTAGELLGFSRCRGVTVADLTIQNSKWNGFKINSDANVQELTITNCVIHNIWQRGVKGVVVPEAVREEFRPKDCRVQYCLFYNDRPKRYADDEADTPENFQGNYIGGLDVMFARDWVISDNVFIGIQGRSGEGRGAIFLWNDSQGCIIERNVIVDCDAGVSLGNPTRAPGVEVHCSDCIVRNNFVTRAHENGIFAALTRDSQIQHNSIHDPASALQRLIRVIMDNQNLVVANNLLSGPPLQNQSNPRARLVGNLTVPQAGFFIAPAEGDLHLREAADEVVGRAEQAWMTVDDIDGTQREPVGDIGADEWDGRVR
jgi:hypothetical protein